MSEVDPGLRLGQPIIYVRCHIMDEQKVRRALTDAEPPVRWLSFGETAAIKQARPVIAQTPFSICADTEWDASVIGASPLNDSVRRALETFFRGWEIVDYVAVGLVDRLLREMGANP